MSPELGGQLLSVFSLDLIYAVAAVAEGAVVFRTPEVRKSTDKMDVSCRAA